MNILNNLARLVNFCALCNCAYVASVCVCVYLFICMIFLDFVDP